MLSTALSIYLDIFPVNMVGASVLEKLRMRKKFKRAIPLDVVSDVPWDFGLVMAFVSQACDTCP